MKIAAGLGSITAPGFYSTLRSWSEADGPSRAIFGFQTETAAVPKPGTLRLVAAALA